MLLNLKFRNIRSFREETNFTMIPSSKKTHKEYIISKDSSLGTIRALPAAVIYGANASGKSNTILAMYALKKIILEGDINSEEVSNIVDVLPFIHDNNYYEPMEIEITFFQNNNVYRYQLSVSSYIGQRRISAESLFINETKIFVRDSNNGVRMPTRELIKKKYISSDDMDENFCNTLLKRLSDTLESHTLFLTSNLKTFIGAYVDEILLWFEKFLVVMNANDVSFRQKDLQVIKDVKGREQELSNRKFFVSKTVNEILKYAEFGNQEIEFMGDKDDIEMVSLYRIPAPIKNIDEVKAIIASSAMESKGTIQLIKLIQPLIDALKVGGIVVLDEMDASLHFEIVVSLLRIFNDKMINKNGAQLIFNTHNPIYLDGDLLRHDQIIMVSKAKESLTSELYALSDYNLRPEERILKNYLDGKYGALPHMDLEIAVKRILEREDEE